MGLCTRAREPGIIPQCSCSNGFNSSGQLVFSISLSTSLTCHYKKTREIRQPYSSEFHQNGHIPTTFRRKPSSEISGRKKKVRQKFVTNSDEIPTSTDRQYSDGYSDNIFHRKSFVGNWSEYISDRCRRRKNVRQNSDDDVTPIFRRRLNPSKFPRARIRRSPSENSDGLFCRK